MYPVCNWLQLKVIHDQALCMCDITIIYQWQCIKLTNPTQGYYFNTAEAEELFSRAGWPAVVDFCVETFVLFNVYDSVSLWRPLAEGCCGLTKKAAFQCRLSAHFNGKIPRLLTSVIQMTHNSTSMLIWKREKSAVTVAKILFVLAV